MYVYDVFWSGELNATLSLFSRFYLSHITSLLGNSMPVNDTGTFLNGFFITK